jgi:hypothetical protein
MAGFIVSCRKRFWKKYSGKTQKLVLGLATKKTEGERMNIGDKVRFSKLAFAEGIADSNSKNMVCKSIPDINGIMTIERDGIRNPKKRRAVRYHQDFIETEKKVSMKEFGKTCYKQGQEAERLRNKKSLEIRRKQIEKEAIRESSDVLISAEYTGAVIEIDYQIEDLKNRLKKEPEKEARK